MTGSDDALVLDGEQVMVIFMNTSIGLKLPKERICNEVAKSCKVCAYCCHFD